MAKRTAIIDIGSNSARLVIFQETSKEGFHLVCEKKSKVRIGEGAYANNNNLQKKAMVRAYSALRSFSQTIDEYSVSKVIAVATSALRDAPNKSIFLNKVKKNLKIDIDIIKGEEEALLGAIAAINLLPIDNGITIDIGGGSTDMSLIKKGEVVESYSLDLGTVRLKELFFDKNIHIDIVRKHISQALNNLPKSFSSRTVIGIGGTTRTLAKAIIKKTAYPLNKLHAFEYKSDEFHEFYEEIVSSKIDKLQTYHIKENRYDTIREGTLIFLEIIKHIEAENIITSGVGVREGVYLKDKFPEKPYKIPYKSNPSIKSIKDRFDILSLPCGNKHNVAKELYVLFKDEFHYDEEYLAILKKVLDLSDIGKILTIYHKDRYASYIAMQELNYGFSHNDMVLISLLLYSKAKKGYHKEMYKQYKDLLPSKRTVILLSFIYTLTLVLHHSSTKAKYRFTLTNNTLLIKSNKTLYLASESINNMKKPNGLKVKIKEV
ncbi:MAG: Ppx/GppA family phosphatase [Sulfurovum sp.]|nr:Ppx/GppA family phosphatase [Sulfurovum sp.]